MIRTWLNLLVGKDLAEMIAEEVIRAYERGFEAGLKKNVAGEEQLKQRPLRGPSTITMLQEGIDTGGDKRSAWWHGRRRSK